MDLSEDGGGSKVGAVFSDAIAYEEMMGRWSSRLAGLFLDFAEVGDADNVLDVGCGTGSLVKGILERTRRAHVVGIDPAEPFIDYARASLPASRAGFDCGSALNLPYPDASFDRSLSLLVFQFLKQPGIAAAEMRRVTRSGGTVAACTWDRTGQEMSELFWEECVRLDPAAEDKAQRPNVCNQAGQLAALWDAAGFEGGRGPGSVCGEPVAGNARSLARRASPAIRGRARSAVLAPGRRIGSPRHPVIYSGFIPASLTTLDVRARSESMVAANSRGELP
jgi:SAM-dependent methyltransferase